jgi:hypothetical protein
MLRKAMLRAASTGAQRRLKRGFYKHVTPTGVSVPHKPHKGDMFIENAETESHKLQGSDMFLAFD